MDSPRAAVEHLTRAIRAADALGLPVQPDLYRSRGLASETIGDFGGARADHEAVLTAARLANDRPREWQALLDLGFLWASRDYGTAGGYFDAALTLAREIGDANRLARSLNRVGNWHLNTGSAEVACGYHEEALAFFRQSGEREGIAETLDLLALATSYRGDALAAAAHYDEGIALFRELGDRRGLVNSLVTSSLLAFVHPSMIVVTAETGVEEALGRTAEAVAIAREIGWPAGEAFALLDSSYCFYAVGDYGSALDAARRSLHIAEEIGHKQWETGARLSFGSMAVDLCTFDVAQRLLEQGGALAREIGSAYWGGMISLLLAYVRLRLGDLDGAEATIDMLLAPDAPMGAWFDRLGWLARAELALARGDSAQALAVVDRLIAGSAHASPTRAIPPLWLVRGEALTALDRYDEAAAVLRQGEAKARQRRARPLLWQILLALGRAEQAGGHRAQADQAFADAGSVIAEIAATIPEGPIPELGIDAARAHFLAATAARFPTPRQPTPLQAAKQAFGGLTARERDVAALIAHGLSNRAIADELSVGERTVATHVGNILAKLDFSSRAQIAAWATDRGLIVPGGGVNVAGGS
jgi:DNA-binding CsgD family transcriptional regulator